MENNKQDILTVLLERKIINENQLLELRNSVLASGAKAEDLLISRKVIDAEKLAEIKAKVWGIGYVNLLEKTITKDVLNIISFEVAENYKVICFNKDDNLIEVGILDYGNLKAIEAVNFLAAENNLQVKYYLISQESFNKALDLYQTLSEEVEVALKARAEEAEAVKEKIGTKEERTDEITKAAPISKIVSVILKHAVEGKASDIHIEPYKNESRVRYRIDGILHTSLILPLSAHNSIVARVKVLANLKLDETRVPQDGRIRLAFDQKRIDFRVSILPLIEAEKVVMRILDVSKGAPKLEDLGYEGRNLAVINKNIQRSDGMFLITGPTGSGKSTTLFAAMTILNEEGVNISTLEDPVEYFLEGANQSQIREEVGFTFATGLRALLRQDPDIIMVGEIRDGETAELAIHAALTGHMVLSTLHTNDAIGTIPRLIDMHVEPFLLASTLNGILAQRLVRRVCNFCKIEEEISQDVHDDIAEEIKKIYDIVDDKIKKLFDETILSEGPKSKKLYKGKGCTRCGNTGYKGRLSIAEVLDVDDELKSIIANGKELNYKSEVLKKQKFITLKQDGIIRALQGVTSIEEVLRVISD
ncbi:MAG: GspE/PulE family protein [Methanoregula sp.]|jgi:type IV pilus assembly protein PilB|nr:GspE/PulE family protein [Methanoregula sp.]